MRVRIDLKYDGTDFSGWARQPGRRTVQYEVETAIARVLRLPEPPDIVCAGRTDAGVHARGQVVHVDLPDLIATPHGPALPPDQALRTRLGRALPPDIAIAGVCAAPTGFDARFSALSRRYVYRLWDAADAVDPLGRRHTVAYPHALDVPAMARAAARLVGYHDFAAFCRPKDHGTTLRTLLALDPVRRPDASIAVTAEADAFCHSMVRSLVGALVAVGRGLRDLAWIDACLASDHRVPDIPVMPAHGLTLEAVRYPPDAELAARAEQARTRRDEEAR